MLTALRRLIGALLALAGLALTVVGAWFAVQLGSAGTAEFTLRPTSTEPVVIPPSVLNRVDADVTVTAVPAPGGSVWMALANPSDATAVLADARRTEVTGVDVRDWLLTTRSTGTGSASDGLGVADLWRQQDEAEGPVALTVQQAEAPETLVVTGQDGAVRSLTLSVTQKAWFVESVVAALVGLFVLVVGVLLAWPRRAASAPAADVAAEPGHPTDTPDHRDPEEAAR